MRKEGTTYRNIMEIVWDKVKFAKKCIKATTTSRQSVSEWQLSSDIYVLFYQECNIKDNEI